jgi:hypothetical protein
MAKIMYGSLAGAISGALGNDVFSHGRHGAYIRRRVIPTAVMNVNTLKVKNVLTVVSRLWSSLSPEYQQAWNTYAQSHPITDRLGQKQVLFGAGAFNQINCRMLLAGDAYLGLPPAIAAPAPLSTLTVVADASAHTVILTTVPNPLGANYRLWIEMALLNAAGADYMENVFKLIVVSAKNQATALGIGAAVELRFGTLIAGCQYIVRVCVEDSRTGLLSGPKDYRDTVVA